MVLKTRTGVTRSSHPSPPPPFSPRATCFHHHDPGGFVRAKRWCCEKLLGAHTALLMPRKSQCPRPSLVHQRGGGTSFFCFFFQFSPIERTIYRPKDLILEIGLGRIKRGSDVTLRHVTSRHVFGYIGIFFLAGITQGPVPHEKSIEEIIENCMKGH